MMFVLLNSLALAARRKRSRDYIGALAMTLVLLLIASLSAWAEGEWSSLESSALPEARFGHSLVALSDGRVALFGGENVEGDLFNDLVCRNGGKWVPEFPWDLPEPRSGQSVVVLADGQIMLFGGKDEAGTVLNDLYSFKDQNWNRLEPKNEPTPARTDHISWARHNKLYVAGGVGQNGQPLSDIWECDPDTGEWQQGPDAPRNYDLVGAGAAIYDDRVYILGPNQDIPYFDYGSDHKFNTPDDSWDSASVHAATSAGPKPGPVKRFAAVTQIGSTAYMVGGYKEGYGETPCTFSFDLVTLVWRYLGPMPVFLQQAAAAIYHGGVLVFGGVMKAGTLNGRAYLYSPAE